MRTTFLAIAMLSAAAVAQSPLSTTFANNNGGSVGGGVYFDLNITDPLGVTITQIDVNSGTVAGTAATLDVFSIPGGRAGNQTNIAAWTGPQSLGNAFTTAGVGLPSVCTLSTPLVLPFGNHGIAFRANNFAHAYTNGNGANQTFSTVQMTLNAGEASNVAFTGGLFTPRVVNCNIHYASGTSGTVATATSFGTGCATVADASFYELMAAGGFDLGNSSMTLINTGSGYLAVPGTSPFQTHVTPTTLALTDDSEAAVTLGGAFPYGRGRTTTSLTVCSNGFISVATGNGVGFTPTVATMLNNPQVGWYNWHDFNPAAGGQVLHETLGSLEVVTFNAVRNFGGTTTADDSTFQIQFDRSTGNVHYVWQTMAATGNGWLVGWSEAGASADPGSIDISTLLPGTFAAGTFAVSPLACSTQRPIAGTNVNITTSNIGPTAIFGAALMGIIQFPGGIPLANMAGCFAYGSGDITLPLFIPGGAATNVTVVSVPNAVGLGLTIQSAVFDPLAGLTVLGALSSNGVQWSIGNL